MQALVQRAYQEPFGSASAPRAASTEAPGAGLLLGQTRCLWGYHNAWDSVSGPTATIKPAGPLVAQQLLSES